VIYDLQREDFSLIPNSLNEYVNRKKGKQFNFPKEEIEIEYIEFLKKKEFIFFLETPELIHNFKELNLDWHYPASISNCIINLDSFNKSRHLFDKVIAELEDKLLCKDLLLLSLKDNSSHLNELLPVFENTSFRSIEIVGNYEECLSEDDILSLLSNYKRIKNIVLFDAPYNKMGIPVKGARMGNYGLFSKPFCYQQPVTFNSFRVNITLFTESQGHNTYYNRKLAIDQNGYIKNSPELDFHYGHISDTTLTEAIEKPGFKDLWEVHKDMIDVCRDCEFRHMCVDACLPLKRPDGSWYRSQECNYNPYICKWEGEEGYKALKDCGVICDHTGYSIDEEKIAEINEVLWAE